MRGSTESNFHYFFIIGDFLYLQCSLERNQRSHRQRRFFDVKGDVVSVEVPTRRLLEFRDDTKEVLFFILLVDQTDVSLNYGLAARQFQTLRIFVFVLYDAIVFVFSVGVEVWVVQRFVCGDSS